MARAALAALLLFGCAFDESGGTKLAPGSPPPKGDSPSADAGSRVADASSTGGSGGNSMPDAASMPTVDAGPADPCRSLSPGTRLCIGSRASGSCQFQNGGLVTVI